MILNPFGVLNGVWIALPGLSPGAIDVEPLSGFIALNCMSNMLTPKLTRMPEGVERQIFKPNIFRRNQYRILLKTKSTHL